MTRRSVFTTVAGWFGFAPSMVSKTDPPKSAISKKIATKTGLLSVPTVLASVPYEWYEMLRGLWKDNGEIWVTHWGGKLECGPYIWQPNPSMHWGVESSALRRGSDVSWEQFGFFLENKLLVLKKHEKGYMDQRIYVTGPIVNNFFYEVHKDFLGVAGTERELNNSREHFWRRFDWRLTRECLQDLNLKGGDMYSVVMHADGSGYLQNGVGEHCATWATQDRAAGAVLRYKYSVLLPDLKISDYQPENKA